MTVNDLHDLVRLLTEHPEWQAELRRLLLTDELLELPAIVRRLAEAQERAYTEFVEYRRITDQRIAELTLAVERLSAEFAEYRRTTDQRIAELTLAVERLSAEFAEYRRTTDQRIAELTLAVERLSAEFAEYRRTTDQRIAELAEAQRRTEQQVAELTQVVGQLSAEFAEYRRTTDQRIAELTLAVERLSAEFAEYRRTTDQRIAELAEAQRRTEEQVARLAEIVAQLCDEVKSLREWQRGEAGRREGERYERNLVKRAALLFMGGQGGATDNPLVQERLVRWLRPILGERILSPAEDPSLADIIWWKGDKVLIGEVSLKIDRHDVWRVLQWAQLLRDAGVDVTPFVAGTEWATPEAQQMAQENGVEWLMDSTPSPGLIAFRRLPDPATALEPPPAD